MKRILAPSVLALALAFSGVPTAPARAENGSNFIQFLAGAVAVMALSNAINGKSGAKAGVSKSVNRPIGVVPPKRGPKSGRYLPSECAFLIRSSRGTRQVLGETCMNETMRFTDSLPRACADTVKIRYGRNARVYDANCLRRYGYRVEAWRH